MFGKNSTYITLSSLPNKPKITDRIKMRSLIVVALFACLAVVALAECPVGWFEACDRPLADFRSPARKVCKEFGYVAKDRCVIPINVGVAANGCCPLGK